MGPDNFGIHSARVVGYDVGLVLNPLALSEIVHCLLSQGGAALRGDRLETPFAMSSAETPSSGHCDRALGFGAREFQSASVLFTGRALCFVFFVRTRGSSDVVRHCAPLECPSAIRSSFRIAGREACSPRCTGLCVAKNLSADHRERLQVCRVRASGESRARSPPGFHPVPSTLGREPAPGLVSSEFQCPGLVAAREDMDSLILSHIPGLFFSVDPLIFRR